MKRVYKFWVYENPNSPKTIRHLTVVSEVINDGSLLSKQCDGHIRFSRNGTITIHDRNPEIVKEETSKDWEEFFNFSSLYDSAIIQASHYGGEINLQQVTINENTEE